MNTFILKSTIIKKPFLLLGLIGISSIYYSQSVWTKHPTPVLARSKVYPNWDGLATADAFVMKDNDTLKMWYSGSGWLTGFDSCAHVRMGYAWSLNGINWNEYSGNPVLDISADTSMFDSDGIETPCVIKDTTAPANQRYKLWYAGRKLQCSNVLDHQFGYAYSPDGIHWTKYSGNPILATGNTTHWYNSFVSNPSVIKEGATYKMWFSAPDAIANGQPTDGKVNIAYATSSDGIVWIVNANPVIVAGEQFNWDTVASAEPHVLKVNNTYHMFYSALDTWSVENFQVGYAYSIDGINWIKSIQNPVLKIGGANQWDRYWASHGGVIYDSSDSKFKMWYTGRDTANISSFNDYFWDIGYADSSIPVNINDYNDINDNFSIYPNPTTDYINIVANLQINNFKVRLVNALGIELLAENNKSIIDISNYASGIYMLKIVSEGALCNKLIIKQ